MTITLTEYLELIVRHNCYAVIDNTDKQRIVAQHPDYNELCHIENEPDTLLEGCWGNGSIERGNVQLRPGLFRLWHIKAWNETENRKRIARASIEASQQAWAAKVQAVVNSFIANGVSKELAEKAVSGLPQAVIEQMALTAQQTTK